MRNWILCFVVAFALLLTAACAVPAPAPAVTANPAPVEEASVAVPEEEIVSNSAEASGVVTTTVYNPAAVPVVLADVAPKGQVYPVLGGDQIMPGWSTGDGAFTVPSGYECLLTSDPFTLYDQNGAVLATDKASVILVGTGSYRLVTLVSPTGSVNAWPTCSNFITPAFILQQHAELSANVAYIASIVELRYAPMNTSVVTSTVVTATAATTSTTVIETIPVEVPATAVPVVAPEPEAVTCVPDDITFLVGYNDPTTDMIVVESSDRWVLAGMDPSLVNGVQYGDRVLLLVQPGQHAEIQGLGYNSEGFANLYACAFTARPSVEVLSSWKLRESDGGTRTVSEVFIED